MQTSDVTYTQPFKGFHSVIHLDTYLETVVCCIYIKIRLKHLKLPLLLLSLSTVTFPQVCQKFISCVLCTDCFIDPGDNNDSLVGMYY